MFASFSLRRVAMALSLCCIASFAGSNIHAESKAATVHLVSIGDTNVPKEFGKKVGEDARNLIAAFEDAFAKAGMTQRLHTHLLVGNDVNPRNVLDVIARLKVGPNDTLLVYYSGHGGMEAGKQHVLTFRLGDLGRDRVLAAMKAKNPRLNVLLTDCCSYGVGVDALDIVPHYAPKPTLDGSVAAWSTMDQLFFRHGGLVDITAAEPGFCGKLDKKKAGSLFTNALLRVLKAPHGELVRHLDRDADGKMQWDEILPQVRGWAAQYDREQYTGKPQQAFATSLGRWIP